MSTREEALQDLRDRINEIMPDASAEEQEQAVQNMLDLARLTLEIMNQEADRVDDEE